MTETNRTFEIKNSEKCFRFKEEAFMNHGPQRKGIYELVHFDDNLKPVVVYVGAAFDKTVKECLEAHAAGTLKPTAEDIMKTHPNLHFDYLEQIGGKTQEDAQDVYWWLVQKYKPPFNDVANTKNSGRPGTIDVVELD